MFKPYKPIKRKSSKRVHGFFYRDNGDTIQYVSFHSTVISIAKNKVVPATEQARASPIKSQYPAASLPSRNLASMQQHSQARLLEAFVRICNVIEILQVACAQIKEHAIV